MIRAGFAETDITPPVGTEKIGWIKKIVSDKVLDPLCARVAVIESGEGRAAFVQLDTLCVRWTVTQDIRRRVEAQYGFPGANVLVAATHNHAGPAVANCGDAKRDDAYVETLVRKVVAAFGEALKSLQEAEVGFGGCAEFNLSHNRRVVMRDGLVKTHGKFEYPTALYVEGPIDPEVTVLAARGRNGRLLGAIVNFACHPTHHGGTGELSAGYPGALAGEMKKRGCPVTLFLNGACGNLSPGSPYGGKTWYDKEYIGAKLAEDAVNAIAAMSFRSSLRVGSRSTTVRLPFRNATEEQIKGTVRGAQRFVDPTAYDRGMPRLLDRIRRMGTQPAEVQAIALDEFSYVSIPAEYFVQHGLRIKEAAHPRRALVVSHANGMIGYVPHKDAFLRGGYETTFGEAWRLAPEAGDVLTDAAITLVRN